MIGKQLGKYRVEKKLGAGGMATVFSATHVTLGNQAALKVLHEHLSDQPAFRERFLREAQAAASLRHSGVMQVFDVDTQDGVCYIAMEYLDGESLEERLLARDQGSGGLPAEEAVAIVTALCESLAYAHQRGIVHRDIKPANVMIGSDGRVVLADFGLATALDQTRITVEGTTAGTPSYMSPEQIRGEQGDGRADIYAVGVMLYQLVSGDLPFQSDTLAGMLQAHLQQEPPPLAEKVEALPEHVARTVEIALRKDPEDRFPTADAMLACLGGDATAESMAATMALESLPGDEQGVTRPLASVEVEKKQSSWRPARYVAGALVVALALVWWFSSLPDRQNDVSTDSDAATDSMASMAKEEVPSMASGVDSMAAMPGWSDAFDANVHGWDETTGDIRRGVVDGTYEIEIGVIDQAVTAHASDGGMYGDLEWRAEATLVEGRPETGYGLVFRRVDARNYYVFGVNGLGEWSVWVLEEGSWRELRGGPQSWTGHPAIRIGERNILTVRAVGSSISLLANGEQIGEVDDTTLASGGVGFYAATPQSGEQATSLVRYDQANVSRR